MLQPRARILVIGTLVAMLALTSAFFLGQVLATGAPTQDPLVYGGVVTDSAGNAPAVATNVAVTLYDAASGGAAVCSAGGAQAAAGTGRFAVTLPKACVDAVHSKSALWAEVAVGPSKVLMPRQKIGAVPYALQAQGAAVAHGVECAGCVGVAAMKFDADVDLGGKTLKAGAVDFGPGAGDELASAAVKTLTGGGNADALHTHAGSGGGGGGVWKVKGVTKATYLPSNAGGLHVINEMCALEFGAARICTLGMLMQAVPHFKAPTDALFWLRRDAECPELAECTMSTITSAPQSNCSFWKSSSGQGAFVGTDGTIKPLPCNEARPIVCCGP